MNNDAIEIAFTIGNVSIPFFGTVHLVGMLVFIIVAVIVYAIYIYEDEPYNKSLGPFFVHGPAFIAIMSMSVLWPICFWMAIVAIPIVVLATIMYAIFILVYRNKEKIKK